MSLVSHTTVRRGAHFLPLLMLALTALAVTLIGSTALRFMTDDAFIAFRYISNAHLGYGYVWNEPPFRPVEGYTSFLWILLLDGIWRVTGVEPPAAANSLALICSLATLAVTGILAWRACADKKSPAECGLLVGLVLLGVATNRTFLTWTSSGLETALVNLMLQGWVLAGVLQRDDRPRRALAWTTLAALLTLARPDGLLFLAATLAALAPALARNRGGWPGRVRLLVALPVLLPLAHLAWRRSFYGEWLPNTFYAKVTGLWPEAGLQYLLSFVLEYAVWFGFVVLAWALLRCRRAGSTRVPRPVFWIAVALFIHVAFYIVVAGGDHFEYRVFSHLVPLGWVVLLWAIARLNLSIRRGTLLLVAAILLAAPVGWTHWVMTRHLKTRQATLKMVVPIAPRWPAPLRWYARAFDDSQAWLIRHFVCCRHQEHKVNLEFIRDLVPPRSLGQQVRDPGGYPVMVFPAVGYVAWSLPYVDILDAHGLNDYVVARLPARRRSDRQMAHERLAPRAYTNCFRPNVEQAGYRNVRLRPRATPLTAADIIACEKRWAAIVAGKVQQP